jgi:hypothetical protein
MREFTTDPMFLQRAILAIKRLEHLIETTPRAAHRLDRLVNDLESVFKRYAGAGDHCYTCNKKVALPAVVHRVFCSDGACRHLVEDRDRRTELLIQESVAEHITSEE